MSREMLTDEPAEISPERAKFETADNKLQEKLAEQADWKADEAAGNAYAEGLAYQAGMDANFYRWRKERLLKGSEQEARKLVAEHLDLYGRAWVAMHDLNDFEIANPVEPGQPDTRPEKIQRTHNELLAKVTRSIKEMQSFEKHQLGKKEKTFEQMWEYFRIGINATAENKAA